ncbi:MAG: LacI family DNA-binding transcriptional regulator [Spirochaetes bacterium]|nr:LacI family DNA-binding transcriptional regulator [Spirochaetota bacterium]
MKGKYRSILVAYDGRGGVSRSTAATFFHGVAHGAATQRGDTVAHFAALDFIESHLDELGDIFPDLSAIIVHRNPVGAKNLAVSIGKALPVLGYGSSAYTVDGPTQHWVAIDEEEVVRRALEHLFEHGHRHIGLLIKNGPAQRLRQKCWRRWLEARELPASDDMVLDLESVPAPEYFRNPRRLKSVLEKTTALFSTTDFDLPPLMHAATRLGVSLPRDLSLVGVDNLDFDAFLQPPLTSVDLNQGAAGAQCVEALSRLWAGDRTPIREFAQAILVQRDSVAKPGSKDG